LLVAFIKRSTQIRDSKWVRSLLVLCERAKTLIKDSKWSVLVSTKLLIKGWANGTSASGGLKKRTPHGQPEACGGATVRSTPPKTRAAGAESAGVFTRDRRTHKVPAVCFALRGRSYGAVSRSAAR
jgi:hypothetical protein